MTRRRIYISGPMRGRPESNYPAFHRAAALFRAAGWVVANPAEIGALFAHDPATPGSDYIREDLIHLARCNAIALLPDWEASVGARCEVACAVTLGLEFWDAESGEPCVEPTRVVVAGGYHRPPGVVESLDALREEAIAWGNRTFTQSTAASKAAHLLREAHELRSAPHDVEEMADVFLLLAHLSDGIDLAGAVRAKLEKNRRRRWGPPDAEGVVEHVPESPA